MSFSTNPALQVNQLPISIDLPRDPERYDEYLTLLLKRISNAVNNKEGSLYTLQELYSFKQYFTEGNPNVFRNAYRYVYDLVALNGGLILAGASVSFPNNISGIMFGTLVYAGCTSQDGKYFSVMGPTSIYLDNENIYFTNPLAATALTSVIAVAEYLKN